MDHSLRLSLFLTLCALSNRFGRNVVYLKGRGRPRLFVIVFPFIILVFLVTEDLEHADARSVRHGKMGCKQGWTDLAEAAILIRERGTYF